MIFRLPILLAFLAVLVLVGSIVILVLAPARIVGVSEATLAASLEGAAGSGLGRQVCVERGEQAFLCRAEAGGGNLAGFRVIVGDDGCWVARNRDPGQGRTRKEIEDCVAISDYLRFSNE